MVHGTLEQELNGFTLQTTKIATLSFLPKKRSEKVGDFRESMNGIKIFAGKLYRTTTDVSLLADKPNKDLSMYDNRWFYLSKGETVLVLRFEDYQSISFSKSMGWKPGILIYLLVGDKVVFMENVDLFVSWFEELEGQ